MVFSVPLQSQEAAPTSGECIIKVIGVGGCGCNAVRHVVSSGLQGMTFIAANTDKQALSRVQANQIVPLGPEGFFEGSGPEYGRWAAEESLVAIKEAVSGTQLVFIVAGMGGRTGTGAAPVIARAARETGAQLIVGVVTSPFLFEGKKRNETAEAGIAELHRHVDSLIVLPNEPLYQAAPKQASLHDLFKQMDESMSVAVGSISNMIAPSGLINLDLADLADVLKGADITGMGFGAASGEQRACKAAMQALACPLLGDVSISKARAVLLNITASPNVTITEVNDAYAVILSEAREDAVILITLVSNESMGDEMCVVLIATAR